MLETENRSKNGCRKWHFGQAQDLKNWAAHLHQELLGVFMTETHVLCYLVIF